MTDPTRRAVLICAAALPFTSAFAALPSTTPIDLPYRELGTARHRTAYIDMGPRDGPIMIFLHGWPQIGLIWRRQLEHFAAAGWRCIAPDVRGNGGSAVPTRVSDYALAEVVADMMELHDALGPKPALWVGHSLGCEVAWALASFHPERCRGVVALTVPHFARGSALANLVPLVDRTIYPVDRYPVGQWDYMLFYAEHFSKAVRAFEANVAATIDGSFMPGSPAAVGKPAPLASIRARGGWFPRDQPAPPPTTLLSSQDRAAVLRAFSRTGFSGSCARYLNDGANLAYAAQAPAFGRIDLPALFIAGEWDTVCDAVHGRYAEPMREDCSHLSEVSLAAGHLLMLEQSVMLNREIERWARRERLDA